MSLVSAAALVAVPGLSFTWRMRLPVPCNKRAGSASVRPGVLTRESFQLLRFRRKLKNAEGSRHVKCLCMGGTPSQQ